MRPDLVRRAGQGDHDAFSALASEAFPQLLRTARLILRDEEQASDAVQDALLSAWLHVRAIRDPEHFEMWLRRLLVRACYREGRRARRRRVIEIHVPELEARGPEDLQAAAADRDQLERGFRRLSIEHRAVLVAHHYLGLRDTEAAAVLEIPTGTYKSRLSRAWNALRAALEADDRSAVRVNESIA